MVYQGKKATISATQLDVFLEEMEWPGTKEEVLEHLSEQGAPEEYLEELANIPDTVYHNGSQVFASLGSASEPELDDSDDPLALGVEKEENEEEEDWNSDADSLE